MASSSASLSVAKKPSWAVWSGKKRTWKGDVKVEIYLRANAPRDAQGNILVPDDNHRAESRYESKQLIWEHGAQPSGGDIVLVRRA